MVMYTLSKTADKLHLNSPVGILVVYLGFGAGLAIFMFSGFVKGIPIEVEEAASVDGAGPLRTYFGVVVPIMKPTIISVGILETMWIWNDYLLPYLIFSGTNYRTIPIHIQYLNGSYGQTDMGAIMALIIVSILPIIIFYFVRSILSKVLLPVLLRDNSQIMLIYNYMLIIKLTVTDPHLRVCFPFVII